MVRDQDSDAISSSFGRDPRQEGTGDESSAAESAQDQGHVSRSSAPNTATTPPVATAPITRSKTGKTKPKIYRDGTVRHGLSCSTKEPASLEIALANKKWKESMNDEYKALIDNKTWHLVSYKRGGNLIDCKWVYRIKRKADGTIDRYT
jgi:hypothetical protein